MGFCNTPTTFQRQSLGYITLRQFQREGKNEYFFVQRVSIKSKYCIRLHKGVTTKTFAITQPHNIYDQRGDIISPYLRTLRNLGEKIAQSDR